MEQTIEKIKAEIERRIKEIPDINDGVMARRTDKIEYKLLNDLLYFINSLLEEPVIEELEEAAIAHLEEYYDTSIIWDKDKECVIRDFIAGAQWQRNHVWHDASERSLLDYGAFMVLGKTGVHIYKNVTVQELALTDTDKWCYLSDILPTK